MRPESTLLAFGKVSIGLLSLATGVALLIWKVNGKESIAMALTTIVSVLLLILLI
jgi:hypothetical protein